VTNPTACGLYLLRFREILRDYSFGDRWIVREFDKPGLPEGHRVSETWEVCDRPRETGEIVNGPLAGRTLHDAIEEFGPALLGTDVTDRFGGRFPLLIKLLDASDVLGEHVHPDDGLVRQWELDDYSGKTEAWYMLRARPGASVYCGPREGVGPAELEAAVRAGEVRGCMRQYPARAGDAFLLHAGTMHWSPGGVLFYEIMQNSDVGVGLRPPKARSPAEVDAHARRCVAAVDLEAGVDCRTRPVTVQVGRNRRSFLIACEHFAVERLDLLEPFRIELDGRHFKVLTCVEGSVTVSAEGGVERLAAGQSCLVPAGGGQVHLDPVGAAAVLDACVPNLEIDVIGELRRLGATDEAIRGLGGRTRRNPLNGLAVSPEGRGR